MADGTLKVGTITTSSGSGTITIGQSGETITVPSGCTITNNGTQTGFGGTNTPNFLVEDSGAQSIANTTITKLSFGTETFDSDGAFASDKFTVPSGKAGKYFFYASWQTATSTDFNEQRIYIYKNGTAIDPNIQGYHDHYGSIQISKLVDLAVSDYIEVYAYQNSGGSIDTLGTSIFSGYKIIE
jgi:hypothetical protein